MRKLFILLSVLFLNISFAQEVSFEVSEQNIIMRGIINPVRVVIENTNCSSVFLKSENANITKNGCNFNIDTNSLEKELVVNVFEIKKNDTLFIDKAILRIIDIPNPIPTIAGQKGGSISENQFKKIGKTAKVECHSEHVHAGYLVSQYTMIVTRKEQVIGMSKNIGNRASENTKQLIESTKIGDTVYILDILCKVQNNIRELDEIKFEIIN